IEAHRFNISVQSEVGTFAVTADSTPLHEAKHRAILDAMGLGRREELLRGLEGGLQRLASPLVPVEIATPPILWNELERCDALRETLRRAGGEGTGQSPLYGFGLHLNPAVAALDAAHILAHLRAFLLLEPWLRRQCEVDRTRSFLPFIDHFPGAYRAQVLDPTYRPDLQDLMADYCRANPTRNRPLDLQTLFAHLDEDYVRDHTDRPDLLSPRPTWHYRLPDCALDDPDWRVVGEWNRWVLVEHLATDPERLQELLRDPALVSGHGGLRGWSERLQHWLTDLRG
ncbi:MAG: amidoligase family protein, partial [Planctomycetota bacterium]